MLFILPESLVEKDQMHQQQNTAAGNENIRHIENGEIDKIRLDHIHHIAQSNPVDHITQTAAVDGRDEPPLGLGKGQRFYEILQHHQRQ